MANGKGKDRLITKLMTEFEGNGLTVKQSTADADWLIASTAVDTAVVATGTDLLVMVTQAMPDMDLYMLSGRNPLQVCFIVIFRKLFIASNNT